MRIMRFIAVVAILCAGFVGQGDAQRGPERTINHASAIVAQENQRQALLNGLLDTFAQCAAPSGAVLKCDVYYTQVSQTSLDVFLSPVLASKLKAKLTATDIEDLKSTISINMVNAYNYGKGKQ